MKLTLSLFGMAAAGLLLVAGSGCKKNDQPSTAPVQQNGVAIESRKLQAALATTTSEEVKKQLTKFSFSLRYRNYVDAMVALDKISSDPSLTEPQKKMVADVIDQVKKANEAKEAGGAAPPAQ